MIFLKTMLVLILALLLPVRGAVAAAGMACSQSTHHQEQASAVAAHDHGATTDAQAHAAGHDHSQAADDARPDADSSKLSATCSLCAACGSSAASLPSSLALVPMFAAPSGKAFPSAAVTPPSHISAGLERPPRSV